MRRKLRATLIVCLLGLTTTVSAFVLSGHSWGTTEVPYYVNATNQDGVSQTAVLAAVQAAAAEWNATSDVQLVYAGLTTTTGFTLNGKNEIVFVPGSSPTTAHAIAKKYVDSEGRIFEADINLYDVGVNWFGGSTGCSSGYYIQDVVTHELGHLFGISHSNVNEATMWGSSGFCATWKRTLHADDIAAMAEMYSAAPPPQGDTYVTVPASVPDTSLICIEGANSQSGCISAGALREQLFGPNEPPPTGPTLAITAWLLGTDGKWRVQFDWGNITSTNVYIYKNGVQWKNVAATQDVGVYYSTGSTSPGPYTFKVCEAGTTICSPDVTGSGS
jgi:hypothetical protein